MKTLLLQRSDAGRLFPTCGSQKEPIMCARRDSHPQAIRQRLSMRSALDQKRKTSRIVSTSTGNGAARIELHRYPSRVFVAGRRPAVRRANRRSMVPPVILLRRRCERVLGRAGADEDRGSLMRPRSRSATYLYLLVNTLTLCGLPTQGEECELRHYAPACWQISKRNLGISSISRRIGHMPTSKMSSLFRSKASGVNSQ
jgi:hypothetical protein